jgi:hypothetical protein
MTSDWDLTKWRRSCRIRDKVCIMCKCNDGSKLQVHHCYPQSLFPEKALLLDNGVTLCLVCHIYVVHAASTFDLTNWNDFTPLWRRYMKLKVIKNFNTKYQHRIQ